MVQEFTPESRGKETFDSVLRHVYHAMDSRWEPVLDPWTQ